MLTEVRCRKLELDLIQENKLLKSQQECHEVVKEYVLLLMKKPDEKSWTNTDLKSAMKALKVDTDGKIPTVKSELVKMDESIKLRYDEVVFQYNKESSVMNGEE